MNSSVRLGSGLYTISEAGRLLRIPRRTVSRWVEGYVGQVRDGERHYEPVVHPEEETFLTFGDLIELRFVKGFRDAGVSLGEIRKSADRFRAEWDTNYPLATRRFATDGRQLLIKQGGAWQQALSGQLLLAFNELTKQLVFDDDLTKEWRPLGVSSSIVLNPELCFGKPIDEKSGTQTHVLASALLTSGDAESVAWWYDTSVKAVQDAARFEESLTAA